MISHWNFQWYHFGINWYFIETLSDATLKLGDITLEKSYITLKLSDFTLEKSYITLELSDITLDWNKMILPVDYKGYHWTGNQ